MRPNRVTIVTPPSGSREHAVRPERDGKKENSEKHNRDLANSIRLLHGSTRDKTAFRVTNSQVHNRTRLGAMATPGVAMWVI